MILPDTSVWIDHLRKPEPELAQALQDDLNQSQGEMRRRMG